MHLIIKEKNLDIGRVLTDRYRLFPNPTSLEHSTYQVVNYYKLNKKQVNNFYKKNNSVICCI